MKQYNAELNTVAVDVALEALFGVKSRDEAKRVYELVNTTMQNAFALGSADASQTFADQTKAIRAEFEAALKQQSNEAVAVIQSAERVGYDKGHAASLFAKAVEELNERAAQVSPALAPQSVLTDCAVEPEETALVNAARALG